MLSEAQNSLPSLRLTVSCVLMSANVESRRLSVRKNYCSLAPRDVTPCSVYQTCQKGRIGSVFTGSDLTNFGRFCLAVTLFGPAAL
jgi:hypothetical protein